MTVARVTQQYIEVGIEPTTRNARVTQQYIEVGIEPTTRNARITQQYIEVGMVDIPPEPPAFTGAQPVVFICM